MKLANNSMKQMLIPGLATLFAVVMGIVSIGIIADMRSDDTSSLSPKTPSITPQITELPPPTPTTFTPSPLSKNTPQNTSTGALPCTNGYATSQEILVALNSYRNAHGAPSLSWNDKLAEVAQMRVSQTLQGGRDYHQGFKDFTSNQDNFYKVGFASLSENIGSACPLQAVHLIEQKIAKSSAHDAAQRDPSWVAVGIASNQGVTSFIFGRDPI